MWSGAGSRAKCIRLLRHPHTLPGRRKGARSSGTLSRSVGARRGVAAGAQGRERGCCFHHCLFHLWPRAHAQSKSSRGSAADTARRMSPRDAFKSSASASMAVPSPASPPSSAAEATSWVLASSALSEARLALSSCSHASPFSMASTLQVRWQGGVPAGLGSEHQKTVGI